MLAPMRARGAGIGRLLAACACLLAWAVLGTAQPLGAGTDGDAVAASAVAGPLGLSEVVLAQQDVRMLLRITTTGGWTTADLGGARDRAICVALAHGEPAIARSRVCVAGRGRGALSFTPLTAAGTTGTTRELQAKVTRPAPNVFEATFLPAAAGLPVGALSWWAESAWTDAQSCARTCSDRFPAQGSAATALGPVGFPPCFGAAARDAAAPCDNPALQSIVEPPLDREHVIPPPYCDTLQRSGLLSVCAFGAVEEEALGTVALVGDSHAAGLKPALQVVTHIKRWRALSLLRSSCPATAGRSRLPTLDRSLACRRWNRQMLAWIVAHPEVGTVVLQAHIGAKVAIAPGQDMEAAVRAGYLDLIRALLAAGRRVVVVRDTPAPAPGHRVCVGAALLDGAPAREACGRRRAEALRRDPLVGAARAARSPGVTIVDLTPQLCDARRCPAVIGGALVHRDRTHLTAAFAATLGPFIARAMAW